MRAGTRYMNNDTKLLFSACYVVIFLRGVIIVWKLREVRG